MIKEIRFWDRMRAQEHTFTDQDVVISITDPNKELAQINGAKEVFRTEFYDVVENVSAFGIIMEPMDIDQAKELHQKVEEWEANRDLKVLTIHCEAGASRSAAIALYAFMYTLSYFPTIGGAMHANVHILGLMEEVTGMPCLSALEVVELEQSDA